MKIPLTKALAALCLLAPSVAFAQNTTGNGLTAEPSPIPHAPDGYDAKRPAIATGSMATVDYDSKSIGVKRTMVIYTPPNYSAATKYPVVYLLHGIGDDETGWWKKGSADTILDNLVADGKIVPMIVVMPNGRASDSALSQSQQAAVTAMNQSIASLVQAETDARSSFLKTTFATTPTPADSAAAAQTLSAAEYKLAVARADAFSKLQDSSNRLNPKQAQTLMAAAYGTGAGGGAGARGGGGGRGGRGGGGGGGGQNDDFAAFEGDLFQDVIPYVESHYSVLTDRANRALLGLSMGGGQTLDFGLTHLDRFAYVAAFSPAPNTKRMTELLPNAAAVTAVNQQLKLLWLSCGDRDTLVGNISKTFLADMDQQGLNHIWHLDSGVHEWPVWKNDLYIVSQKLFR